MRGKVNFIARNREAAGGGRRQGKVEKKGGGGAGGGGEKPPGESEAPIQVIPMQPKAPKEAKKPQRTEGEATKIVPKVTENCRPSILTSKSEATNRVASRSTSLRPQTSTSSLSKRPHPSQAKASNQQKPRPQSSRLQANQPKLPMRGKPGRKEEKSGNDLVTGMINRNLHHLLSQIFLHQVQLSNFCSCGPLVLYVL